MHKINAALQILPKSRDKDVYSLVDKAIEVIAQSGLKYQVCPFETVIEGTYEEVMEVVNKAQEACFAQGAEDMMVYIKLQRNRTKDVAIEEKMDKYS